MQKELLRHLRLLTGLSQAELGKLVGLHQTSIGKMEQGELAITSEVQTKLLRVFSDYGIGGLEVALLNNLFDARKVKAGVQL